MCLYALFLCPSLYNMGYPDAVTEAEAEEEAALQAGIYIYMHLSIRFFLVIRIGLSHLKGALQLLSKRHK